MGFFDDYATPVDQITTGFGLPIGTYPVVLSDIKNFQKKDGSWAIVISFTVDTLNDPDGRSGKDDIWLNAPKQGDPNADTNARIGKQTLLSIGVPESELATFNADTDKEKVIGVTGVLNITPGKGEYTNKKFVRAAETSGVASPVAASVPETKSETDIDFSKW